LNNEETQSSVGAAIQTMETNSKVVTVKAKSVSREVRSSNYDVTRLSLNPTDVMQRILSEELFLGMLCLDRKRAERSGKKLVLLLLDAEGAEKSGRKAQVMEGVIKAAKTARRETDPAGWYKQNSILGIIFTELGAAEADTTISKLLDKVREALALNVSAQDFKYIYMSIHVFGEDSDEHGQANPAFYPDLFHPDDSKKTSRVVKRAMDIIGSSVALILFAPLFLLIAMFVKLTSKGPVLFKQERLGQFGKTFTCLKFRSMRVNNDLRIHQEFMKRVISGAHDGRAHGSSSPVYKMTNDPRITGVGRFIRRTSLDELPQFINVLRGDMSLVGPRPPLAYEYEEYDVWHRRRVLELKPGLTGLWQVSGRSRVRFDDMVRLDLQYARDWSFWLDMRILLQTPRAVVLGDGAY
jgi:exopolysaccharide biosynthesis polyprenyl glycosylphosphotransferase